MAVLRTIFASLMPRMLKTGFLINTIDIPAIENASRIRRISKVLSIPHFFLHLLIKVIIPLINSNIRFPVKLYLYHKIYSSKITNWKRLENN